MRYRPDIWKKLQDVRSRTVSSCSLCRGGGYLLTSTPGEVRPCKCMIVFKYVSKLIAAEIPTEYWSLSLETLQLDDAYKKVARFFLKHFDNVVHRSLGLLLMGRNGVGKTALACELGKQAIVRGYSVKYFTAEEYLTSLQPGKESLREDYLSADMLILDELGKNYAKEGSSFAMTKMEDFLRKALTCKVLIACTNFAEDDLIDLLGDSTVSVMQRHLKFLVVEGQDYSGTLHDQWKEAIRTNYDFFTPEILACATLKEKIAQGGSSEDISSEQE